VSNKALIQAPYPIFFGDNVLAELNTFLSENFSQHKKIILCDTNTLSLCLPLIEFADLSELADFEIIEVPEGEESKSVETCNGIWQSLLEMNADKNTLLINLGGGMICDLGGFIASVYKRGIPFIHLPTSLLAQVDASIGGKTAINLGEVKNQIGTFTNPNAVIVYPEFLESLPQVEIRTGLAEMLKHCLIASEKDFYTLLGLMPFTLKKLSALIKKSIRIKHRIVKLDPTEKNLRKSLNFGHTIGHAIESYFIAKNSELTHGHAVALGMYMELYLSRKKLALSENEYKTASDFICINYPFVSLKGCTKRLLQLMHADKKNENGMINFTLLQQIGKAVINQYCTEIEIAEAIDFYTVNYKKIAH
jgi:3-dehydroquinate synthase